MSKKVVIDKPGRCPYRFYGMCDLVRCKSIKCLASTDEFPKDCPLEDCEDK